MGGFGIPSLPIMSLLFSGIIEAVLSVEISSEAVIAVLVAGVVGAVSSAASSIFVWHFLMHVGVKPLRWQPFLLCLFCMALCIVVAAMHPVSVIDVCDRGLVAGILMAAAWSDGTCRLVPDALPYGGVGLHLILLIGAHLYAGTQSAILSAVFHATLNAVGMVALLAVAALCCRKSHGSRSTDKTLSSRLPHRAPIDPRRSPAESFCVIPPITPAVVTTSVVSTAPSELTLRSSDTNTRSAAPIGGGDIKLIACIAFCCGWWSTLSLVGVACLLTLASAILRQLYSRLHAAKNRKPFSVYSRLLSHTTFPFVPSIAVAFWIVSL